MDNKKLIENCVNILNENSAIVEGYSSLTYNQLNWRVSENKWSVGQCIDHLVTTNRLYLGIFERLAVDKYPDNVWMKINPFSKMLGKWLVKYTGNRVVKPLKSPGAFRPSSSNIEPEIINQFGVLQVDLIQSLKAIGKIDINKKIIASPANKWITYPLKDAIVIVTEHEVRHISQANGVRESIPENID